MKLPTSIDDIVISGAATQLPKLTSLVTGRIPFPDAGSNSILLHGRYGSGKTLLANMLPIMIEYERRSPQERLDYDFCYRHLGCEVSITPQHKGKKKLYAAHQFVGCGNKGRQTALEKIESGMQLDRDIFGPEMFNYFILDEVDMLDRYQQNLKSLLTNQYSWNVFILTTNFIGRIDKGLRSRSWEFEMNAADPQDVLPLIRRKYNFDTVSDEDLVGLIADEKGDMRAIGRMCETLQKQLDSRITFQPHVTLTT